MSSAKTKILIVEDNEDQAKYLAKLLDQTGLYEPLITHNGFEALEEVHKHRSLIGFGKNKLGCILLDLMMPELNGLEFIKILRREEMKNGIRNHIPVIVVTAYDDEEKWEAVTDPVYGKAAAYLTKPFEKDILLTTLEKVQAEYAASDDDSILTDYI